MEKLMIDAPLQLQHHCEVTLSWDVQLDLLIQLQHFPASLHHSAIELAVYWQDLSLTL